MSTSKKPDFKLENGEVLVRTKALLLGHLNKTRGIRSGTTLDNWFALGCPGARESDGFYNVTATLEWERTFYPEREAEAVRQAATEQDDERAYLAAVAELINSNAWEAAVSGMLHRYPAKVATFEDLTGEARAVLGWKVGVLDSPIGGTTAVRFARSRRYLWCGLSKGFAEGIASLVAAGSAWVVPVGCLEFDEDSWKVDLPTDGKGDTWSRWVLSANEGHRELACGESLEAVLKPKLRLINPAPWNHREDLLSQLGDFESLGLMTPDMQTEWVSQLANRVGELQKKQKPANGRAKTKR